MRSAFSCGMLKMLAASNFAILSAVMPFFNLEGTMCVIHYYFHHIYGSRAQYCMWGRFGRTGQGFGCLMCLDTDTFTLLYHMVPLFLRPPPEVTWV